MTLLITQDIIERLYSVEQAIPVIEDAFAMAGRGGTENPARFVLPVGDGFMRMGAAALHEKKVMGFKLWANFGSGPSQSWNYLFSTETGELLAIMHAYSLGRFRTSAATAVAAKYLARSNASTIGLYGTGRLAESQIRAVAAVRPIKKVKAYSRTPKSREAFSAEATKTLGFPVVAAATPEEAAADVDIVLTITNSHHPVFHGTWLTKPALVLGIGANQWFEREINEDLIRSAGLIVVDHKEQAKRESGDLLWAAAHGALSWDRVRELGDIVVGNYKLPDLNATSVLFESHGIAIEDVAVSAAVYEIAVAKGLGTQVNLTLGKARSELVSPGVTTPVRR
jgi:ornithine cyclodeaminase/alanine dehydrogenase